MKRSRRVHNPRYQKLYSAPKNKKVVMIWMWGKNLSISVFLITEFGKNEETLTLAQIPNHDHTVDMHSGSIDGGTRAGTQNTSSSAANIKTNAVGGGEAHNNIQPSKVVGKWLRTA